MQKVRVWLHGLARASGWMNDCRVDGSYLKLHRSLRPSTRYQSNTARVIYMTGDFLLVLMKMKQVSNQHYPDCPYVCHLRGQVIKELKHGWKSACQTICLVGKTFHDLRRTGVRNLVRAGVPEAVAMKISGHQTRSVFDRYNITSEEEFKEAATRLGDCINKKKDTFLVTPDDFDVRVACQSKAKGIETIKKNMVPPTRIERAARGLGSRLVRNY